MKRFLALLIAAVLALMGLYGCKGPDTQEPTAVPATDVVIADPTESGQPEVTAAVVTDVPATEAPLPTDVLTEAPVVTEVPATDEPATEAPATAEPQETATVPAETELPATATAEPTQVPTATPTQAPTATATSTPTPAPTKTPTPTPAPTEEIKLGPTSATNVTFNASNITKYFTGGNQVTATSVEDSDYGRAVKLSTVSASIDPFISFNYKSYMTDYGLTPASASDYKIVLLKVKQSNCSSSQTEIFYWTGSNYVAQAGFSKTSTFDNTDTDWQFIVFNLSTANGWSNTINGFRFDYMFTAAAAGESFTIGELILLRTMDDVAAYFGGTSEDLHALSGADQQKAEQLISSASDPAPKVANTKLNAAHEDSDITLWFNHSYVKTPEASTQSTGLNTYQIRMAKNEIEGVQFLLASTKAKTGLTAELTPFTDASGHTLKHVLCYGYYFADVEGQSIVDPIPELEGSFDLKANMSKTFLIKVYTEQDSAAGQYSAVLTIKDSAGNEIKKANVYVYVWNFALPLASNCKIQADLSWWNIYSANPPWTYYGDDGLAYERYYEYLLENKVNAYNLPYMDASADSANPFPDSRVNKYLNDPRVQCFNPVGFGTDRVTQTRVQNAYNYLKQNPEWLAKAYFYPVDEPIYVQHDPKVHNLEDLVNLGNMIKSIFGSQYKIIAPMHINRAVNADSTADYFSYVADVVNVWCPKTYFFNTVADYKNNPALMVQYYTALMEKNLGTFIDRMAAEQAGGDEVWWYVTRFPHHPEITLSISDPEVEHRILFWQQKLYNVDGFLYYMVNDWWLDYIWTAKHETDNSYPYNVYGNGVLVYNGFKDANGDFYISREHFDEMDDHSFYAYPVGCLRLESVRDGAEDIDYFTILDDLYGEGTSDLIIKQITTSLGNYSDDDELFNSLRIAVGNLIAAKS